MAREYLVVETVYPVPHVKLVLCKSHKVTDLYNNTQHKCTILQWPDFFKLLYVLLCALS